MGRSSTLPSTGSTAGNLRVQSAISEDAPQDAILFLEFLALFQALALLLRSPTADANAAVPAAPLRGQGSRGLQIRENCRQRRAGGRERERERERERKKKERCSFCEGALQLCFSWARQGQHTLSAHHSPRAILWSCGASPNFVGWSGRAKRALETPERASRKACSAHGRLKEESRSSRSARTGAPQDLRRVASFWSVPGDVMDATVPQSSQRVEPGHARTHTHTQRNDRAG